MRTMRFPYVSEEQRIEMVKRVLPWWLSGKKKSACQCRRQVRSLMWEDPMCHRVMEPVHHNC